ncbi:MAG: L-lysine 2,3-aminomutase [Verrucomicrobia subdivision 3 bacterium]|nr:L-lysine 2,3-aminomutase [Limisphaerales bacterium]MCS1414867.1 L-lysine 2,3-aminomutase [Limisphaerales bacterium]
MLDSIVAETSAGLQSSSSSDPFRNFETTSKGAWEAISDLDWNDWRWQLKNRITTLAQIEDLIPNLPTEEREGIQLADQKLSLAITPYYFNLIDPDNVQCPIRQQVVPKINETKTADWEMTDPCGEDNNSPVPGIVHRYPDRILFLVTDRCAAYCRYCTRSRMVSNATGYNFHPELERQLDYVREHSEIRDVLLSGGDPLLLSDSKIDYLLSRLRAIDHVEFLRIGSRIPIFLPQRITRDLCATIKKYHPLFVSIHTNHPIELTAEVKVGLDRLADAGIPLGNQSVLLRHVNDRLDVMRSLVRKLLRCRVRPYYLYQCDLISGSSHLRTSVTEGIKIIKGLQGHTTGYAVPQFVIDAPGGGGKIPINPKSIISHNANQIVIRNYEGQTFEYPEIPERPIN